MIYVRSPTPERRRCAIDTAEEEEEEEEAMSGTAERTVRHDFGRLPDLAARRAGGSVVCASDELFAEKENLIKSGPPGFAAATFGPKGQIYDGWETRRRRSAGHDWAIIRLGLPGVVSGVVVDTAFFTGNYPPEISVEGCGVEGYPDPAELAAAEWLPLVPRAGVAGDAVNEFEVSASCRVTHVRLRIYPDGGVARLRVHGCAVPDPRLLRGGLTDIAALANGAQVTGCSNMFYSSPSNLISPGEARNMGEGWETARRRDDANDWVEIRMAAAGRIRLAELDTSYFVGNAPGWAALTGQPGSVGLLPRTRLQPDTPHRFRIEGEAEVTGVRLDVYPDGGMARLRLPAELTASAREQLALRWFNLLPESQAATVLATAGDTRRTTLAARPLTSITSLPPSLQAQLRG
jgi:allantoicase